MSRPPWLISGRRLRYVRPPPAQPRQAWTLLATVLLLSLSVTGINVAFSYIGNYFTNALVKKNQDLAYLYCRVYFCGFLIGIPIVAMYGYVQNYWACAGGSG